MVLSLDLTNVSYPPEKASEIHAHQGFKGLLNQATTQGIQNPQSYGLALVIPACLQ